MSGTIWDTLGCPRHLHRNGRYNTGLQETCAHLHQWQEARQDTKKLLKQVTGAPNTASKLQAGGVTQGVLRHCWEQGQKSPFFLLLTPAGPLCPSWQQAREGVSRIFFHQRRGKKTGTMLREWKARCSCYLGKESSLQISPRALRFLLFVPPRHDYWKRALDGGEEFLWEVPNDNMNNSLEYLFLLLIPSTVLPSPIPAFQIHILFSIPCFPHCCQLLASFTSFDCMLFT